MRYFIRVSGRVQGVGFRAFAHERARKFRLTGWVKNCPDGTVESEAQGKEADLRIFLEELKSGNRWARVENLEFAALPEVKNETDFKIEL